jgi:hypothetical protein
MDIPAVEGIARTFQAVSETLKGVVTSLDVLINILNATAFVGAVGGAVLAQFMEIIKRQLDNMADKTEEVSKDVTAAVEAYQRGDEQGATKFY